MDEIQTKVRRLEIEWQTKVLATFISHTVQDGKAAQKLIDAAATLSLTEDTEMPPNADTSGDGDTRTLEEIMEHGSVEQALRRNSLRKGPGLPFMDDKSVGERGG